MSKFEYVKLADAIAADITNGTLRLFLISYRMSIKTYKFDEK